MRSKDEIVKSVQSELKANRSSPEKRQEVLLAVLFEVLCDIRDVGLIVMGLAEPTVDGEEVQSDDKPAT